MTHAVLSPGTEETPLGATPRPRVSRVVVADDHWLIRTSLVRMMTELVPSATILEATDYREFLTLMEREPAVDLVLLDLVMPGLQDWRAELPGIIAELVGTSIVIVSALEDLDMIRRLSAAGIVGYIPKRYDAATMHKIVQLVLSGASYLPVEFMARPMASWPGAATGLEPLELAALTQRQREVLALLAQGQTNKEIARALDLSESTIKVHLNSIYRQLRVNNRTEAALLARGQVSAAAAEGKT